MPTYAVLGKLTDDGVKDIRNIRQRMERNRASGEKRGIKLIGWYLAQGSYDILVIVEAPDDITMSAQTLIVAGFGASRSETLRLFPLEEADKIIEKMGER